jgi:hypothetical protein
MRLVGFGGRSCDGFKACDDVDEFAVTGFFEVALNSGGSEALL